MTAAESLAPASPMGVEDKLGEEDIASMLAEAEALDAYFARRGRSGDLLLTLMKIFVAKQK
jgi:hypothetical protein